MKKKYLLALVIIPCYLFADTVIVKINGNNNNVIISSENITIDAKVYKINQVKLSIDGLPKDKIQFNGARTEILNNSDPRIIDDVFTYCDDEEQIDQAKKWLKNPYSGYPRLLELYKTLLNKYKSKLAISGNRIPLMILNSKLLMQLGRETNKPLKPNENVSEKDLLEALYNSWREKNSN